MTNKLKFVLFFKRYLALKKNKNKTKIKVSQKKKKKKKKTKNKKEKKNPEFAEPKTRQYD